VLCLLNIVYFLITAMQAMHYCTALCQYVAVTRMTETRRVNTWSPLDYLSPEELARLDERFDYNLRDATCLVFWTGLSPELAQCWAAQHGLETLVIAMGPLYSERGIGGARYGKSSKAWSKYMRGASGRFAEYACRGRRAIVVTKPPPNIYSTREWSNYRHLEEPILKGALGGLGALQIDYVHPTNKAAATFQYQVWPVDRSSAWYTFFRTCLPQGGTTRDIDDKSVKGEVIVGTGIVQESVMRNQRDILALADGKGKAQEKEARRKNAELERQQAREMKEANRKRAEEARAKKEAKQKKAELKRRKAQAKKEQSRKQAK
jgi:hypothetical protein